MRRRETRIPILSMLDLLFGAFGAMIVVAIMLTFLRLEEPRLAPRPMYFAAVKLSPGQGTSDLDLSPLFIDFLVEPRSRVFSPLPAGASFGADGSSEPEFYASSGSDGPAAALLIPHGFIVEVGRLGEKLRLGARVRGLPTVVDGLNEGFSLGDTRLRISVMIQTARFGCAAEREVDFGILLYRDARLRGVSVFELMGSAASNVICSDPQGRGVAATEPPFFKVDSDGFLAIPAQ